jgi:hypothetical protein
LYTYTHDGRLLWVLIYVDDALIVDNYPALRESFVLDLGKRFPVEDKGSLSWILSVAISRDRKARLLTLSQELYISDLLSKCEGFVNMDSARRFDSPLEENCDLSPSQSPVIGSDEYVGLAAQRTLFMTVVGGLLWLANMTRYDVAYAASTLARVLSNPGPVHIRAATRVLIYLKCTQSRVLAFAPHADFQLDVYVDSNWSSKFSCTGMLCYYMGCLFQWFSKTQRSVSLSSAEAEFFGAMLCAREVTFIRELLLDLALPFHNPSVIFSDSKSSVDMSLDPVAFKKTKHILRAAEFLRDLVAREVVRLVHLAGSHMIADILTKAAARPIFLQLIRFLDDYGTYRSEALPVVVKQARALAVHFPRHVQLHVPPRDSMGCTGCQPCELPNDMSGGHAHGRPSRTSPPSLHRPFRPSVVFRLVRPSAGSSRVATTGYVARARRFGPLRRGALCYCQCPHAVDGCEHEVMHDDRSLYCDFCLFEQSDIEEPCHCDCDGCVPPIE